MFCAGRYRSVRLCIWAKAQSPMLVRLMGSFRLSMVLQLRKALGAICK